MSRGRRMAAAAWLALIAGATIQSCGGEANQRSSLGMPDGSSGGGSGGTGGTADGAAGCSAITVFGGRVEPCEANNGLSCCDGVCRYPGNDPLNCGACGHACPPSTPYCNDGVCHTAPAWCAACSSGSLCCRVHTSGGGAGAPNDGGPGPEEGCYTPENGTCPIGCPMCLCAAFDTQVATPEGERPISTLRVGDLVWSIDHGSTRLVPILRTNRTPASHHHMVEVTLESGRVIRMSERHPTATGQPFAELSPGDLLGESQVEGIRSVPYEGDATYDILPDSDTGLYFAAGAPVGSTLTSAQR